MSLSLSLCVVAPWCGGKIQAHRQISDRLAYIKLRVIGGTLGIITAYAPHNMKPLPERFNFYVALDDAYKKCSANQGKVVCGDLNARIGRCQPGE